MATLTKDEVEALVNEIERLAFTIPPVNSVTPEIVQCCVQLRAILPSLRQPSEPVAWLGLAKGTDKARHPIGRSLLFPENEMDKNLNWYPLYAHPAPRPAVDETEKLQLIYDWFLRECTAEPDSGELVDAGARPAFNAVCDLLVRTKPALDEAKEREAFESFLSQELSFNAACDYSQYMWTAWLARAKQDGQT